MSDEDDFDIVTVAEVEVVIGGDGRGGTELGEGGACDDDPPPCTSQRCSHIVWRFLSAGPVLFLCGSHQL